MPTAAQTLNGSANVTLVLRIPETASLRPAVLPLSKAMNDKLDESALRASAVVLQSEWRFAAGQTVHAEAGFMNDPAEGSGLLAMGLSPETSPEKERAEFPPIESAMNSFVARSSTQRITLLNGFMPQRGERSQINGFLAYAPKDAETQVIPR
jgi:hypothetical protein